MTIRQAIDARVRFVRLPEWVPTAHLELPLLPDGHCGPWGIVRDPSGEVSVLLTELMTHDDNRYEAWGRHQQ